MGYGCGDSFPFDFEPNRIPFGSKSKGKLSPRSYPKYGFHLVQNRKENCHHNHILFNIKGNRSIVFSVYVRCR